MQQVNIRLYTGKIHNTTQHEAILHACISEFDKVTNGRLANERLCGQPLLLALLDWLKGEVFILAPKGNSKVFKHSLFGIRPHI